MTTKTKKKDNNKKKKLRGFTLIELVLVIAVLGILAVAALPSMFSISLSSARTSAMRGTVGSIQTGLSLLAASQLSNGTSVDYPVNLEATDLADGTAAAGAVLLFDSILQNGVNAQWVKKDDDCYVFDTDSSGAVNAGDVYFQYLEAAGTFLEAATC